MKRAYIYILIGLLGFGALPAYAQWSPPAQAPTGGNAAAPINVSSTAQTKVGGMILNTGGATNGLIVYGRVGVAVASPSYNMHIGGTVGATAYYYTSDRTLKKDVRPLEGSLSKVLKLQGVSFRWKEDGRQSIGLIAQEVEKVYPEIVNEDPNTGLKSVEYGNLAASLIEAIKEQQKQIDELKREIETLKAAK